MTQPQNPAARTIRIKGGEWAIRRRGGGFLPWVVVHLWTRLEFAASSKETAKRDIANGFFARQVEKRFGPKTEGRRDWYTDPLTGEAHLYTGGLFSWHCDVHNRVCDPFRPVTTDQLLAHAANDEKVSDDVFIVLRRALENRPITD